jgi:hypothetical protein
MDAIQHTAITLCVGFINTGRFFCCLDLSFEVWSTYRVPCTAAAECSVDTSIWAVSSQLIAVSVARCTTAAVNMEQFGQTVLMLCTLPARLIICADHLMGSGMMGS